MNVVFVSNFFNHHQRFFSDKMYELTNGNYAFIETEKIDDERKNMGWGENQIPKYVHYYHESPAKEQLCSDLIRNADIVISGSASEKYLKPTHFKRKLVFRYSERPFKSNLLSAKYILRVYLSEVAKHLTVSRSYLLCASAYSASDFAKMGFYKNKTYKWGYFPEQKAYDISSLMSGKDRRELLWCGRFLDWKHPDDAIEVAKLLKKNSYNFHMSVIGVGPMEDELSKRVSAYGLAKNVTFLGSMTPTQVRGCMEKAGIFLFTSDQNEGWGAVVNEAMNSGCAVVAGKQAGSSPYLVQEGINGYMYESQDVEALYNKVAFLLDHPEEQAKMGAEAYRSIQNTWNADEAAVRLFRLLQSIQGGQRYPDLYAEGPCSKT